jgi:hypothetical protein
VKSYYVNKEADAKGDYIIHCEDCLKLPVFEKREYLGRYQYCFGALTEAKDRYRQVNGCMECCKDCNKEKILV